MCDVELWVKCLIEERLRGNYKWLFKHHQMMVSTLILNDIYCNIPVWIVRMSRFVILRGEMFFIGNIFQLRTHKSAKNFGDI